MTFSKLGLSPKVLSAVEAAGYSVPTPIQAEAIPHILDKKDVLGVAQTGTGKTASFTLPMLTLLEKGRARARMPRTLILEPTRELAAQVEENFIKYGVNHRLTVALLIGGVSFEDQNRKLDRGADVLIATPGRLLDHFERGKLLLSAVDIFVIDEADRMLDMGFIPDIERICSLLPFTRQTLFFSATMPAAISGLAEKFLHNPVKVEVSRPASVASTVRQQLTGTGSKPWDKRATLRDLLNTVKDLKNAIVFCNRKRDVATLYRSLTRHDFKAAALHGDMDQHQRMAMLDQFKSGELNILVASDVAARGLDIPAVSHVFNFDVPTHAEDYVHRIGRTGRAGREGTAISLVAKSDTKYIAAIEKLTGDKIEWIGDGITSSSETPERQETRKPRRSRKPRATSTSANNNSQERTPVQSSGNDTPAKSETPAIRPVVQQPRKAEATNPSQPKPVSRPPRRSRQPSRGDRQVKGLGDHVPAFLLRPIRPAEKPSE
ncbi:MAG: DEAD/DEAH box helicase [Cohaesibacteraceae bacterium]|nr:DEAD/DEAH box helicase [Cohaesibacteraceae bacterium]